MIEILFLLGFSLHNIEEALWLPAWSEKAKRFHKQVGETEFRFALIVVTALGYLFTFQYFIYANSSLVSRFIYLGFILMMVLNAVFPHLLATIILRSYAPGTITGLTVNVPIGMYILSNNIHGYSDVLYTVSAGIILSILIIMMINFLFKIGKIIFD